MRPSFVFLLVILAFVACCDATSGTETGVECVKSDLIEQCPLGSDPRLDAASSSKCEGSGDLKLIEESGSVTGSCVGEGSCQVLCQFAVPCDCGVDEITTEGVKCTVCGEQPACGNGTCEGTESVESCPSDCGAQCVTDRERCDGNDRQICNLAGQWETVACPTGTQCSALETDRNLTECAPQ